jgi:hypothetical protein
MSKEIVSWHEAGKLYIEDETSGETDGKAGTIS